jgi:hypothetical protein
MDEDRLRRLYAAAVFLMQKPTERRGLTRDQIVAVTDKIHEDLMKDYDPSIVDVYLMLEMGLEGVGDGIRWCWRWD